MKGRNCPWENRDLHDVMDLRDRAKLKAKATRILEDLETYKKKS